VPTISASSPAPGVGPGEHRAVGRQVLLAVIFLLSEAAKLTTSPERMLATGQTGAAAFPLPITWRQFLTAVAATHGIPCPVAVPAWLFRRMVPYLGCLMIETSMRVSRAKATRERGSNPAMPNLHVGLAGGSDERAR
jgi:hypothetical protein